MSEALGDKVTVRYERVEPCPDCTKGKHILESGGIVPCPGGSRTILEPTEPDYEAAYEALIGLAKSGELYPTHSTRWKERAAAIVDAVLVGKVVIDE